MASQFQVSHFEDYSHIGSRKWKEFFRNNLLFSITPFDKLQEPNWDSIVHNVWRNKNKFHQNLYGCICNRPDRGQKSIWKIEKKKEGSQAMFENWQIIRVTKLYSKNVSVLVKFVFYWVGGGLEVALKKLSIEFYLRAT